MILKRDALRADERVAASLRSAFNMFKDEGTETISKRVRYLEALLRGVT